MGKWTLGFLGVVGVVLLTWWGSYNSLVSKDESVNGQWSEVQNQLNRRAELIPNLVNTVKGYAEHESGVFKEVTEARAKVSQAVNVDVSKLAGDPALQKQLLDAQQGLNASLGRLIAVAENYPQLKANENFLKLQDELAGTQNRIAVARRNAIIATQDYNRSTRSFPTNIVAGLNGFTAKEYYEAPEGDRNVPQVSFSK